VVRRSPGAPLEPTGLPTETADIASNYDAALPLLRAATVQSSLIAPPTEKTKQTQFDALHGLVPHTTLIDTLRSFRWVTADYFAPDLAYYEELVGDVDDWLVVLPQTGNRGYRRILPGVGERSLFRRERTRYPLFQNISDPKHRHAVLRVAGAAAGYGDPVVEGLRQSRRGALLIYPLVEHDLDPPRTDDRIKPEDVVIAFNLVAPQGAAPSSGQLVQFVARNKAANAPIVDVPDV
jgi:hypothetical protein